MTSIGILVGEDADLPKNLIKDLPVEVFPFVTDWEGYKAMRGKKINPKTSQPSAEILKIFYLKNLKKYKSILVFTISSSLSGAYNSAIQAKKLLPKDFQKRIHILDSQTSTGAEGLIVLKILEILKDHPKESIDAIIKKANSFIASVHLLGVFDDPCYLQKGGRINFVQGLVIKNMLKAGFRPILTVQNGKIVTKKIQREKDKANALFAQFREEIDSIHGGNVIVAITHGDCAKDAKKLKKLVENYSKSVKIEFVNIISPVVGSHLGPDSLIISWIVG